MTELEQFTCPKCGALFTEYVGYIHFRDPWCPKCEPSRPALTMADLVFDTTRPRKSYIALFTTEPKEGEQK